MMLWLTEPLSLDFMQQALFIGLVVSISAAQLSSFLVLKGWSLMGDAVSHAVLPGIVIAYLLGIPYLIGAFATGLFCAVSTGYITENSRLKEDTVMGVVFSALFALGVVMFTKIETELHLDHVLFGDILGLSWRDVIGTTMLCLFVSVAIFVKRRDLLVFSFDDVHASVIGLNTKLLHYGLLSMLSLLIVASMKAVGIILVIAVLIAPGAIAFMLSDRFERMQVIAMVAAAVCTFIGIILSYHIDSAPAPTIVVIMTGLFVLVFLFAPNRGILRKRIEREVG
ncbi:MAG: metal ABC transporter permease [Granulosicoccaceae bacterium]